MRSSLRSLQAFVETMNITAKQFEDHISLSALNYGLNLIPDDVLPKIFAYVAETLEEKVGLSLVCRRFRTVMLSMRKMWVGHPLVIGQTPEQMVAIAEGNRFSSLKAEIWDRDDVRSSDYNADWTEQRGLDPEEIVDRFYKRSLDFILPLRLEELRFYEYEDVEETQRILDSLAMQSAHSLMIQGCRNSVLRSFERRHTPSLQNLWVDFVPGRTLGKVLLGALWSVSNAMIWTP